MKYILFITSFASLITTMVLSFQLSKITHDITRYDSSEIQILEDERNLIHEINENLVRKRLLETLQNPNISTLIKIELWNIYTKPMSINGGDISNGGLWKDWNMKF